MGEEVRGTSQAGNTLPSATHVRIETEEERIERVAREEEGRIEREALEALDQLFEGAVPEGETEAERIAREDRRRGNGSFRKGNATDVEECGIQRLPDQAGFHPVATRLQGKDQKPVRV